VRKEPKTIACNVALNSQSWEALAGLMEHYQASQTWTVGWAVRCFQAALEEQGAIEAPKGRNVRGITVRLSQSVVDLIRAVAEETPLRKQARVVKAALVWMWQKVLEKRGVPTP
jgi:hypothetical protein